MKLGFREKKFSLSILACFAHVAIFGCFVAWDYQGFGLPLGFGLLLGFGVLCRFL